MLRISGLHLSLDEETTKLPILAAKKLGIKEKDILEWHIFKQSLDARKSSKIKFVFTIDVLLKNELGVLSSNKLAQVSYTPSYDYEYVSTGPEKLKSPPVIIGTGPAGLFAGLLLAQMGYQPLLLERGDDVDTRAKKVQHFWETGLLDNTSNVQFGEGGAGTFSDGKLTTLIKDIRCRKVLEELVKAGAPADILYSFKPHIGTDILRNVVKSIRQKIIELGGNILFCSQVTDLLLAGNELQGVIVNEKERILCQAAILAIGHSARDTFKLLYDRKVELSVKPFSIGVRIEHPQALINKAQYKEHALHPKLGAADYKLAYHSPSGRSAYTFCMCPGGMVVAAASESGHLVTNGMSFHARDGLNANSALLVGVNPNDFLEDHPLAGINFQRKWEQKAFEQGGSNYCAPGQQVGDFLANKTSQRFLSVQPTYKPGVIPGNLRDCLPQFVADTIQEALVHFEKKLKGFAFHEALLTGIETRSSSPIRIVRNDQYEGNIAGLYPAGEGAGYAGGIISAAVDGLRVAEFIARRFQPIRTMFF